MQSIDDVLYGAARRCLEVENLCISEVRQIIPEGLDPSLPCQKFKKYRDNFFMAEGSSLSEIRDRFPPYTVCPENCGRCSISVKFSKFFDPNEEISDVTMADAVSLSVALYLCEIGGEIRRRTKAGGRELVILSGTSRCNLLLEMERWHKAGIRDAYLSSYRIDNGECSQFKKFDDIDYTNMVSVTPKKVQKMIPNFNRCNSECSCCVITAVGIINSGNQHNVYTQLHDYKKLEMIFDGFKIVRQEDAVEAFIRGCEEWLDSLGERRRKMEEKKQKKDKDVIDSLNELLNGENSGDNVDESIFDFFQKF